MNSQGQKDVKKNNPAEQRQEDEAELTGNLDSRSQNQTAEERLEEADAGSADNVNKWNDNSDVSKGVVNTTGDEGAVENANGSNKVKENGRNTNSCVVKGAHDEELGPGIAAAVSLMNNDSQKKDGISVEMKVLVQKEERIGVRDEGRMSELKAAARGTSDSMDTDMSLRNTENEQDNALQSKKDTARQSCEFMGYSKEDIEWAIEKYKHENGGNEDYSGRDLAEFIEDKPVEAPDVHFDPGPSQINENPSRIVTTTTATVTDLGLSPDGSSEHLFEIVIGPLPPNMIGCNPKFVLKTDTI